MFVSDGGRVVGIESKTSADFSTSVSSRRLQRQLRGLLEAVDVPVLGLRMEPGSRWGFEAEERLWFGYTKAREELVKWQMLGGLIAFLPHSAAARLRSFERYRLLLTTTRNTRTIVAGTDKPHPVEGTPFAQAMQRLFKGVGPTLARRLDTHFQGDFQAALAGDWSEVEGIGKSVIAQKEALLT